MPSRYAAQTTVSVAKSKGELEGLLRKYGADNTLVGESAAQGLAFAAFTMRGRSVKLTLPLPKREDFTTRMLRGRKQKADKAWQDKAWEQACRQRWRALVLMLKAKLEFVELIPDAFDYTFMSDFVLPNSHGRTIGEEMAAQLDNLETVPLLPMGKP